MDSQTGVGGAIHFSPPPPFSLLIYPLDGDTQVVFFALFTSIQLGMLMLFLFPLQSYLPLTSHLELDIYSALLCSATSRDQIDRQKEQKLPNWIDSCPVLMDLTRLSPSLSLASHSHSDSHSSAFFSWSRYSLQVCMCVFLYVLMPDPDRDEQRDSFFLSWLYLSLVQFGWIINQSID